MYFIKDLIDKKTYGPYASRQELLFHWRTKQVNYYNYWMTWKCRGQLLFSELNLSGNDVRRSHEFATGCYVLRRYQVVDEQGRPQDIKTWTKEIKEVEATPSNLWLPVPKKKENRPRFRVDPVVTSFSRRKLHRSPNPAFTKQKLMERDRNWVANEVDFEEDLMEYTPVVDHSRPRTPTWTYKKFKTSDVACWKRQSKNEFQWARHKPRLHDAQKRIDEIMNENEDELWADSLLDDILDFEYFFDEEYEKCRCDMPEWHR